MVGNKKTAATHKKKPNHWFYHVYAYFGECVASVRTFVATQLLLKTTIHINNINKAVWAYACVCV